MKFRMREVERGFKPGDPRTPENEFDESAGGPVKPRDWPKPYKFWRHLTGGSRFWPIMLAVFIAIFLLGALAQAYTYESKIDPQIFASWDKIKIWPSSDPSALKAFFLCVNPDPNGEIKRVFLRVLTYPIPMITGYAFRVDGELFVYEVTRKSWATKSWHYARVVPSPEDEYRILNSLDWGHIQGTNA